MVRDIANTHNCKSRETKQQNKKRAKRNESCLEGLVERIKI
jgi:hypothetical protein